MEIIPTHFRLTNKEIISGVIRIPDNPELENLEYYSSSRKIRIVFLQTDSQGLEIKADSYIPSELYPFKAELQSKLLNKLTEIRDVPENVEFL